MRVISGLLQPRPQFLIVELELIDNQFSSVFPGRKPRGKDVTLRVVILPLNTRYRVPTHI